jgi:hypothetical protein
VHGGGQYAAGGMGVAEGEGMNVSEIDMQILRSAVSHSAARYLHPDRVEKLIACGYLAILNEHSANVTDEGRAAFVRGR